ncbi:ROK family protein [Corynebacterium pseudopelargi]|uniref:Fructokinase n=1 Tax=Corynebacterium pseudopelargi TaxID=2080757 RepID=A0A3G6IW29_9CORY|nr:ROK family protein [Corynebacterium pseudopelargi]AZA09989.1 Fructokinase [Corynebacterium pseudopelargi]
MHSIGIDIGGTKIAGGIVAEQPTTILRRVQAPTPKEQVIEQVVECIAELINAHDEPIGSIGIGAPGVVDPHSGKVISAGPTMPTWAGTDIRCAVAAAFPNTAIAIHNDVRVMGLGEALYGAGRGYQSALFLSLGTGVGGAIVRNGHLLDSPHHTAGELRCLFGRLPNGQAATIESFAAGPGLTLAYEQAAGEQGLDLREVMRRYHRGDALAYEVIDTHLFALGEAISGFVAAIDVEVLVLGGGVGNIGAPILDPFTRGIRSGGIAPSNTIAVHQAQLGTDAPIIGAAALGARSMSTKNF